MTKPSDPHSVLRDLSSFADGELDPVAARRLLAQLTNDSQAAETLQQLQHLKTAARRAIRNETPPPSPALRERLRQLMVAEPQTGRDYWVSPIQIIKFRSYSLRRALAAGVLLAIGVGIGHYWPRPNLPGVNDRAITADILPAAEISNAEEIHGFCSRLAEGLHQAGYPTDLAPLASAVESDLHSDHPYPDLGPIGYRYRGAGPCGRPLPDTAHLLYRSIRPGSVKAVSVFVQGWHDQYPLDAGRLYTVSVASSPFPMLAWRTDKVVYFLLADDKATVQKAAEFIRQKPASRP